jgi:hypothetical protein
MLSTLPQSLYLIAICLGLYRVHYTYVVMLYLPDNIPQTTPSLRIYADLKVLILPQLEKLRLSIASR